MVESYTVYGSIGISICKNTVNSVFSVLDKEKSGSFKNTGYGSPIKNYVTVLVNSHKCSSVSRT